MTVDRLVQIKSGVAGYEFSDSSQAIWIRALISGDYEYRGEQIAITPEQGGEAYDLLRRTFQTHDHFEFEP